MSNKAIPFSFELVFILWMGLITAFSLLPVPEVGAPEKSDKIAHFIMYLITCGIFYFTFRPRIKKIILWAGVFSFAYGLFMELVQGDTTLQGVFLRRLVCQHCWGSVDVIISNGQG